MADPVLQTLWIITAISVTVFVLSVIAWVFHTLHEIQSLRARLTAVEKSAERTTLNIKSLDMRTRDLPKTYTVEKSTDIWPEPNIIE